MWRLGIIASVFLVCQSLLVPGLPAAQRLFASSQVTTRWYPLEARSLEGLKKEMQERGPIDQYGIPRDAVTRWKIRWTWPQNVSPPERFALADASLRINLEFPTPLYADELPKLSQREWRRYYAALVAHEYLHAATAHRTTHRIEATLREGGLAGRLRDDREAHREARRLISKNHSWDLSFDRSTDHGRRDGVYLRIFSPETTNHGS